MQDAQTDPTSLFSSLTDNIPHFELQEKKHLTVAMFAEARSTVLQSYQAFEAILVLTTLNLKRKGLFSSQVIN